MSDVPKRVLFVCVENSNRSQMAEAFARMHATAGVEGHSAGSRPSGKVNPRAIEFMAERGYDLTTHRSKSTEEFHGQEVGCQAPGHCFRIDLDSRQRRRYCFKNKR